MNKKKVIAFLIILINISPGLISGQRTTANKPMVQLGVSEINITPETPILMSGYSARTTPYKEIHDSLFATALFFTGEKTRILLITSDLIGLPFDFIDDLKKNDFTKD